MKRIIFYLLILITVLSGCVPTFDEVGNLPDDPSILEVLIGNENGKIAQENAIYPGNYIDTVWVKDKSTDFSNVYLQANLEAGCKVEPLEGSNPFGEYGDFSAPQKYRVTAPTGNSADWTVVLDYYIPPVGCLADRWVGDLICNDEIYPSYNPTFCKGEKVNDDCHLIKLSFDFWADAGAVAEMDLQLGEINMDTFTGDVTLLNDVMVTSYGADMTFHKGYCGTYNATSNELHLSFEFSGYDIGGVNYDFTITQQ